MPVDIRLHGLMATVEYFTGRGEAADPEGTGGGTRVGRGAVEGDVASGGEDRAGREGMGCEGAEEGGYGNLHVSIAARVGVALRMIGGMSLDMRCPRRSGLVDWI